MAEKRKKPEVRFKGFIDEWEEHKLGELADIVRGASPRPIQDPKWFDETSTVGWLRISDVTEQDGRIHYLEQRISKAGEEKTRVLTQPHLLLSIAASVGKPVVNYVDTGVHDGFLIFKNPIFDQEFMFQWMKMFEEQWQKYGQPGSQVNLNSEIVKNQDISVPINDEQSKIGTYFKQLDTLITLHQRKYDKLVTIKKAMLEKMFPKNGATIPEIRFKGFTGAWEELELGNIATMKARIGWQGLTQKEFLENGNYYLITGTDFENGTIDISNCHYISEYRYNQDLNIQVRDGDVLITKDGTIGKVAYIGYLDKPATLNAGVFVIRGKNKSISNLYLYHYLAAPFLLDYADKQATGGTIKHLNQNVLVGFPVPLPHIDEQTKIGNYFKHLDNLLTLYQRELEKLKNIKKAMLEKMFV